MIMLFYVEDDANYSDPWQVKLHWPGRLDKDVTIKSTQTHYDALFAANEANLSLIEDSKAGDLND